MIKRGSILNALRSALSLQSGAGFDCPLIVSDELAATVKAPSKIVVEWGRSGSITLARLKKLAQKTDMLLGYSFLHEPPDDSLSIPGFHTSNKNAMPIPPTAN